MRRRRHNCGSHEFGQVDIICEVNASLAWQNFNDTSVGRFERQFRDIYRVIEKVSIVISETYENRATFIKSGRIGRVAGCRWCHIVVGRCAGTAATGREK